MDKLFQFAFQCRSCEAVLRIKPLWLLIALVVAIPLFYLVLELGIFPVGLVIPVVVVFVLLAFAPLVVINAPNS
jgi:hypothetical protein